LGVDSVIVSECPSCWPGFLSLFKELAGKRFTLLWRVSRDGFGARDFHNRCDGHGNTLTFIEDTGGNIFGGFSPLTWESECRHKADSSGKSFLFTLKNPHNFPAKKFALGAKENGKAIFCHFGYGPSFGGLDISDNCNANARSASDLGFAFYTNDTGLDGTTFFTGSLTFTAKEIEVFEITF
jgi:hypothetical protein